MPSPWVASKVSLITQYFSLKEQDYFSLKEQDKNGCFEGITHKSLVRKRNDRNIKIVINPISIPSSSEADDEDGMLPAL